LSFRLVVLGLGVLTGAGAGLDGFDALAGAELDALAGLGLDGFDAVADAELDDFDELAGLGLDGFDALAGSTAPGGVVAVGTAATAAGGCLTFQVRSSRFLPCGWLAGGCPGGGRFAVVLEVPC
jgi:hypothetical protein